jgi:hypothetical protein
VWPFLPQKSQDGKSLSFIILLIFIYFNCACTEPIIPYTRQTDQANNIQRLLVPLYCILMALLGATTPYLLLIGKWGAHTCSHPYGGFVGKATMVRSIVVKTHSRQRELNPTSVEPPTVRHLPLEHACSSLSFIIDDFHPPLLWCLPLTSLLPRN